MDLLRALRGPINPPIDSPRAVPAEPGDGDLQKADESCENRVAFLEPQPFPRTSSTALEFCVCFGVGNILPGHYLAFSRQLIPFLSSGKQVRKDAP